MDAAVRVVPVPFLTPPAAVTVGATVVFFSSSELSLDSESDRSLALVNHLLISLIYICLLCNNDY